MMSCKGWVEKRSQAQRLGQQYSGEERSTGKSGHGDGGAESPNERQTLVLLKKHNQSYDEKILDEYWEGVSWTLSYVIKALSCFFFTGPISVF